MELDLPRACKINHRDVTLVSRVHTHRYHIGERTLIQTPSKPFEPSSWIDPKRIAEVVREGQISDALNGTPFGSWSEASETEAAWKPRQFRSDGRMGFVPEPSWRSCDRAATARSADDLCLTGRSLWQTDFTLDAAFQVLLRQESSFGSQQSNQIVLTLAAAVTYTPQWRCGTYACSVGSIENDSNFSGLID